MWRSVVPGCGDVAAAVSWPPVFFLKGPIVTGKQNERINLQVLFFCFRWAVGARMADVVLATDYSVKYSVTTQRLPSDSGTQ